MPADRPTRLTRRRLLGATGATCLLSLAAGLRGVQASLAPVEGRRLSFHHTHTGENLAVCYFDAGAYLAEGMHRVQHLFRDFRSGQAHEVDGALLDILHALQRLADRDGAYEIISAYRSPGTNAQLRRQSKGVATRSLHMEGRAIDVRLPGFSTRRLAELARGLQRGGVGLYTASDFIHVDTGRVRSW